MATDWTQDADCEVAYLFEEGSGTTVADASGNSRTGNFKASGEPAWSTTVPSDVGSSGSVDFDGSNDYISLGDLGDFETDAYLGLTIVTYLKTTQTTKAEIVGQNDLGIDNDIFVFEINRTSSDGNTSGAIGWYVRTSSASVNGGGHNSDSGINDGSFNHLGIVMDWNKDTPDAYIYVNGVSKSITWQQRNKLTSGWNFSRSLYLGAQNGQSFINHYDGIYDEFAMFIGVKDSTDINDIMDNGLKQSAVSTIKRRMLMGVGV